MKDPNEPCLFCNVKKTGFTHENNLAYASYDSYPVSEYHCLIIPKRHIENFFELKNPQHSVSKFFFNCTYLEKKHFSLSFHF